MIFDWYTEDKQATGWIARQLTIMGVPTIRGKSEWNRGTVRDMLVNPIYIGKLWWNRSNTVKEFNPDTGKLEKVRRWNQEPEIFNGKHPAIISVEQFEKACSLAKTKKPATKVDKELVNPLAGILECCDCGRNIIAIRFNDGRVPRMTHARDTICKKKSLPMDLVLDAVCDALKAVIADFEMKMDDNGNMDEIEAHHAQIAVSENELEKLERKRKKLFQDYEDETYTRDEFIERKQLYMKRIDELKKQIREAKEAVPEPVNYSEQIVNLHAMIDCIKNPDYSAKRKNDFLKLFLDKITYDTIDFGQRKGGKPVLEVFLK
jgi:site-specific DNA recombinase